MMRKNTTSSRSRPVGTLAGLLLASALVLQPVNAVFAAPSVGTAAAVQGDVFVSTEGARRKAQVRGSIKLNDEVQTKDDSALQILLLDETVFTVGQNCTIIIDEFVYDPATSAGEVSAQVLTGAFRYMSGQVSKVNPENVTVSTPSSTIGIRGTIIEGIVGGDAVALARLGGLNIADGDFSGASITILRGPGSGSNTLDQQGAITVTSGGVTRTILEPGFAILTLSPDLPPIGPFEVTQEMLDYLDFFLRSTPAGESENPTGLTTTGSDESGQDQFEGSPTGGDPNVDNNGGTSGGIEDDLVEDNGEEDPPQEVEEAGGCEIACLGGGE